MMFELPMYTLIHVVISVVGVVAGLVVAGGLVGGSRLNGWTALFLLLTILTSVTGFGFPRNGTSPAQVVGGISLIVLAVCLAALYWKRLAGGWHATFVISAVAALYLNVFVLVVQLFAKTPPLVQLAPTQQEAPFAATQILILALFVWLGRAALQGSKSG